MKKYWMFLPPLVALVFYVLSKVPSVQAKIGIEHAYNMALASAVFFIIFALIAWYQKLNTYSKNRSTGRPSDEKGRRRFVALCMSVSFCILVVLFGWLEKDSFSKPAVKSKREDSFSHAVYNPFRFRKIALYVYAEHLKKNKPDELKQQPVINQQQPATPDIASLIRTKDDTARAQFNRNKQLLIARAKAERKRYNDSVTASNNSCKLSDSLTKAWQGLQDEVLAKVNKDMPKVQPVSTCGVKTSQKSLTATFKPKTSKRVVWKKVNQSQSIAAGYKKITW